MLALTGIDRILSTIGFIYWFLLLIGIFFAFKLTKSILGRIVALSVVIGAFGYMPLKTNEEHNQLRAKQQIINTRFETLCKNAGERTFKPVVEDVDGIVLLKIRPEGINYGTQFELDDPYGSDYGGNAYIGSFLWGRNGAGKLDETSTLNRAFQYVVAIEDGRPYRYTGYLLDPYHFALKKELSGSDMPRYGVTYEDISTADDRKMWIAGSALRVVDLKTNEVIAERIGYMMDPGQGNNSGGRSPWLLAAYHACPKFPAVDPGNNENPKQAGQARRFVEKILKATPQE